MTDEPSLGSRALRTLWKQAPRLVASLVIAGGFVWLFHKGGLPLLPPRSAFSKLQLWAVPAYATLVIVALYFRTHRWLYLLRPIAPDIAGRRIVGIGLVGIAAILFAPLRMGEAARPYLLARDGKVSFFQALGAAGAERVVDGLVMTLVTAVALLLSTPISPLPNHLGDMPLPVSAIPRAVYVMLTVFACAFVAMTVFYGARDFARRITQAVLGLVSMKLANFVTGTLERLSDGLRFLSSVDNGIRFTVETLAYWSATFVAQWLLMRGCGIDGTFAEACVSLGVLGLGAVVPAGPGFFGAFQVAIYSGLALYSSQATLVSSGAAMVFVAYASQLVLTALGCTVGLLLLRAGRITALRSEPDAIATHADTQTSSDSGA
jgi:glycosyltransferase 2 family protein